MSEYSDKLRDRRWQEKRLRIMQRDNFKCRDCSPHKRSFDELQVHHLKYAKDPWDVDDQFLITLCGPCHTNRHAIEKFLRDALARFMAVSSSHEVAVLADTIKEMADGVKMEHAMEGTFKFMSETRWIAHAKEYPAMREHVEAVLGRKVRWKEAP